MEQALEAQKKNPKKILIRFLWQIGVVLVSKWKNTLCNVEILKYINENFYAVKFDAEGNEFVTFNGKQFSNPKYDVNKNLIQEAFFNISSPVI